MSTGARTYPAAPQRVAQYTVLTRILHWLTAVLVITTLFVGFVMVNWPLGYATLLTLHKVLGAAVLGVVVIRIVNRVTHHAPALPATVGKWERLMVFGSELAMYVLLVAQPLIGWAMLSASGAPVVLAGLVPLPPIAPTNLTLYSILRESHSVAAYLLIAVITAHVCAVLLHSIALGDGMLRRMTFSRMRKGAASRSSAS